jgi:TRAP-type C4-dicarboxylate transport system substrate-binding protein
LAVLALFCLLSGPELALELKFGHYAAETHPGHKATLMFADAVKKRTNGEITVKM